MKKLLLVLVAVIGISFAANAQGYNGKAIGLRFGYGTEVSYQMPMGANRLEVDLGRLETLFNDYWHYFTGAVTYQWLFSLPWKGFGWYAGPGAGVGWYASSYYHSGIAVGVGGIIGIDYKFPSIPLQASLDFRPLWSVIHPDYVGGFDYSTALGVRYTF
ncbi:MAG: hypothetical protein IKR29_05000 [Bacteroidales bacterium]|nr:hypothetical protein [Bacteroidales bacterium]